MKQLFKHITLISLVFMQAKNGRPHFGNGRIRAIL